ncbi:MAG: MFS transporter [Rhodothermales bacterium]|nr:MFS transporter [Rhodothermales bacterium]MBO6778363.1 MFS transporter [Rhodothermales bacterium]
MRLSLLDGVFAVQYTTLTAGPFLVAFLLVLGASAPQIGLVGALPLLGGLLQPLGAEIIRRRGGHRKGLLVTAALVDALLWSVSLAAVIWLSPGAALITVLAVITVQQGALAFAGTAWTSLISDLVPVRLRGRYFGTRNFVANGFGAITAVVAGWAVRVAPGDPIPVFLVCFGIGVLSRLVSIRYLARQQEPAPDRIPPGTFLARFRRPFGDLAFRRYLTFGAAWGFGIWFVAPFFTVYMLEEAGIGLHSVMLFTAAGTVSNLLGQRVWGRICDTYGDKQVMSLSGLTVALQPLWWIFTASSGPGFYLIVLLSITGGFAWGGFTLATGNLMMRLAPADGKTPFFATQAAVGGSFGAAGSLLGGVLAGILLGTPGFASLDLLDGLKTLFVLSFLIRTLAWLLLLRVPDPVRRKRLRGVYVIRDTVRSLNPAHGFGPNSGLFLSGRSRPERNSR